MIILQNNFGYIVQNDYRQAEGMFYVLGVTSAFLCNAYYFLFFFLFFSKTVKSSAIICSTTENPKIIQNRSQCFLRISKYVGEKYCCSTHLFLIVELWHLVCTEIGFEGSWFFFSWPELNYTELTFTAKYIC